MSSPTEEAPELSRRARRAITVVGAIAMFPIFALAFGIFALTAIPAMLIALPLLLASTFRDHGGPQPPVQLGLPAPPHAPPAHAH